MYFKLTPNNAGSVIPSNAETPVTFVYGKRHFKEDVVEESGTVESAGDQVAQQEKAEHIS